MHKNASSENICTLYEVRGNVRINIYTKMRTFSNVKKTFEFSYTGKQTHPLISEPTSSGRWGTNAGGIQEIATHLGLRVFPHLQCGKGVEDVSEC